MKKKNTFLGVLMLIAVLALGIGYALTADNLVIGGSATAQANASNFKVEFTDNITTTDEVTDAEGATLSKIEATKTSTTTATVTATLTQANDTQTATFEITNASQTGLDATIKTIGVYKKGSTTEAFTSEYFTVTVDKTSVAKLTVGEKTTVAVTVKLNKAVLTEVTEEFDVVLSGIEAVAAQ